ncbi:MAG TPA: hypothetical protein VJ691_13245 [Vicinamibacterales bacterium]|nr:hypothetical protein [Vicinamibacterales bacterium]
MGHSTYLPTIETPRPREPFDEASASDLREAQPEFLVIGDSMAGVRIDPRHLSRVSGRSVAGLFQQGSPVAFWYLQLKNMVVGNGLTKVRGVVLFFRDDQLTTQVEVNGPILDRVARDHEPELDRVFASHRLGRFSDVHRVARAVYQFDLTRAWLEPRILRVPASSPDVVNAVNNEIFALDKLRPFEAADLPQAEDSFLDFDEQVGRSVLPLILDLAEASNIRLAFIRVQRRPAPGGPPPQSEALSRYLERLKAYVTARGAYYHDDYGDPNQPLSVYADGDHLRSDQRLPYSERFAKQHAAFLQ